MSAKLTYKVFLNKVIGGVFSRIDETGFRRIWGHLLHRKDHQVTFWRHKEGVSFAFMFIESYEIPTTVDNKEDEKRSKEYEPVKFHSSSNRALMREIYQAYLRVVEGDSFHYTKKTGKA